jgi:hypothetical protein
MLHDVRGALYRAGNEKGRARFTLEKCLLYDVHPLSIGGIPMAANPGFPLSLDVRGYPVLVLGGDEEAAEKTQRLLEAGAKVTVVAPTLHDTLKQLAASAKVVHRGRHFRETDLESAIFVLNMVRGDREFSRSLFAKACEKKFLLWSVDHPETSNVIMPAVVASGHVRVAVSTSGVAPAVTESSPRSWNGWGSCVNRRKQLNRMPRSGGRCCGRRWMDSGCWGRSTIRKSGLSNGLHRK